MSQPTSNHGDPHLDTVTGYTVSEMGQGKRGVLKIPFRFYHLLKAELIITHVSHLSLDQTMAAAGNKNSTKPTKAYFNATINNSISVKIKQSLQMLNWTRCWDKRHKLVLSQTKAGKPTILEKDKRTTTLGNSKL